MATVLKGAIHMAENTSSVERESATPAQSVVSGTKALIDTTWSVVSFVFGSEAEWPGYDSDEA